MKRYSVTVLGLAMAGSIACSSNEWTPERRQLAEHETESSQGFSALDVNEGFGAFQTEANWQTNDGFELAPSTGSSPAVLTFALADQPVYEVTPCAPGDDGRPDIGNHVRDCRQFLEIGVDLRIRTADGVLDEHVTGLAKAHSPDEWIFHASTPTIDGTYRVVSGPAGTYSYVFHAEHADSALSGWFSGVVHFESDENSGGGTGFTATLWQAGARATEAM